MPNCKICKLSESWLYWFMASGLCVQCYCALDRERHPIILTTEQIEERELRDRAFQKWNKGHKTPKKEKVSRVRIFFSMCGGAVFTLGVIVSYASLRSNSPYIVLGMIIIVIGGYYLYWSGRSE